MLPYEDNKDVIKGQSYLRVLTITHYLE